MKPIASDQAGKKRLTDISVVPVMGNPRQVKVAPTNDWQAGRDYYLFISKEVQTTASAGAQKLTSGIRMCFNVVPTSNCAPEAKNVTITGSFAIESTLTGNYTYSDADNDHGARHLSC